VVWRGPMKMAAIKQFIEDVNWGGNTPRSSASPKPARPD